MHPEEVMLMKMEVQAFAKVLGRKRITKTARIYVGKSDRFGYERYSYVKLIYSAHKGRWFRDSVKNDKGVDWGDEGVCLALKEVHSKLMDEIIEKVVAKHKAEVLALIGVEVVNF